jgi:hypothetical protein
VSLFDETKAANVPLLAERSHHPAIRRGHIQIGRQLPDCQRGTLLLQDCGHNQRGNNRDRHRAATVSYYWQMIVNGLLVTALDMVLLVLVRRLLRLSSRLDKLIPLGQ